MPIKHKEHTVDLRLELTHNNVFYSMKCIFVSLTAVKFEHQQDREVVEEAAVQY